MDDLQFSAIARFYLPADLANMTARQQKIAIWAIQNCLASWTMNREIPLNSASARFLKTNLRTLSRCFPDGWYRTRYDHIQGTSTDYVAIPEDVSIDGLREAVV